MLVLAGPGSGKTSVIVSRIRELIRSGHAQPSEILAVTFSRASADEMRERFQAEYRIRNGSLPEFGTFHSIFLKILKEYGRSPDLKLISEREKYIFVRSELEASKEVPDNPDESVRDCLLKISRFKSQILIDPDTYSDSLAEMLYLKYSAYLKENGLIDFDDIIIMCFRLLKGSPDILKKCRSKYRYILIDEFQDISPLQYETIRLIAGNECNIFAVGDDDQSIYGFRGAAPQMLMRFLNQYPGCSCVSLNINYRSDPKILDISEKLISCNKDRLPKSQSAYMSAAFSRTEPVYKNLSMIKPVNINSYNNRREEFQDIVRMIKDMICKTGQSCAVLFRHNADTALLISLLSAADIPYSFKGSEPDFRDHFIVKDILAYIKAGLCLSQNIDHDEGLRASLLKIINRPVRYISRNAFTLSTSAVPVSCFESAEKYYSGNPQMLRSIKRLSEDLQMIGSLSPYAAIRYITDAVGYREWLREYAVQNHTDFESYENVIDTLKDYAADFSSFTDLIESLTITSENVIRRPVKGNEYQQVQIMTMHGSKGLEFDHVFLPIVNEGVIPSKRSVQTGQIEEERRLLYVAMTRARKSLHISWSSHLHNTKAAPSRFLSDINISG